MSSPRRPCAGHVIPTTDSDDDLGTRVLITGRFLASDRPHLLQFTWSNSNWLDPTAVSVVNVEFEHFGEDQTLMSIEHSLLAPDEFDNFDKGWARTADQLAALLHRGWLGLSVTGFPVCTIAPASVGGCSVGV